MERQENNQNSKYMALGFVLGFGSFLFYDLLTRESDLKNLKKNLIDLKKESYQVLKGLKNHYEASSKFRKNLKKIDDYLGTDLSSFLANYTPPKESSMKKRKPQFFKIKK